METSFRRTKPVPAAPAVALSTASTPVAGTVHCKKTSSLHQEFHQPESVSLDVWSCANWWILNSVGALLPSTCSKLAMFFSGNLY
jgi:hypothetical protein